MMRILDTNVCIDILRGRRPVLDRLAQCSPRECVISVVTEFELFQGAARAPERFRDEERQKVERFVSLLQVLAFDSQCARIAGVLNASLLNAGTPVSIADVWIGATGIRHGWVVVTNNMRDFERFEGLKLEDWR